MARTLTSLSASGPTTEVSKPVIPNSKGPSSLRARQPRSQVIPTGTRSSGQTTESSPAVRVMEENCAAVAQSGTAEPASSRQTARRSPSTERRSEVVGAFALVSPTPDLLDVAGGPGASAADVGDEPCDLLGSGVVRGDGEHRVLARYGAHDLEPLHPIEDAGDGPGGPVTGVYDDQVLGRGEAEDEAGQYFDAGRARVVRECEVTDSDLEDAEFGEVPAHCGLRGLHTLLGKEGLDHPLLGAELPLGDQ